MSDSFPPRLMRTRLYEQVAGQISTWIADNGLRAGDRLPPERELAQRLGVSRASVSTPASAETRPLTMKIVSLVRATDTPEKRATSALLPIT